MSNVKESNIDNHKHENIELSNEKIDLLFQDFATDFHFDNSHQNAYCGYRSTTILQNCKQHTEIETLHQADHKLSPYFSHEQSSEYYGKDKNEAFKPKWQNNFIDLVTPIHSSIFSNNDFNSCFSCETPISSPLQFFDTPGEDDTDLYLSGDDGHFAMSANRKKLKTLNCLESPVRDSLWSPLHETLSQPEVMEIPKIKKSKTLPCSFDESPSTRSDDLTLTALKRKYFGESSSAAHFSNSSSLNPLTTPKRMLPSVSYNNMQADPVLIEDDEEEEYTEKEIDTETEDFQIDEDKPIQASKMNDDQSKTNCKLMKSLSLPLKPKFKELKLSKNVREKLAEDQRRNASIKPLLIGEYEIYLVADSREKRYDEESTAFVEELRLRGIKTLRRSLSVGDFLWIARKSRGKNFLDSENEAEEFCEAYSEELVLDCVVERKTVADLHHSIRDMRFDEQRHRLSTCGCSSIIYLIEGKLSSSLFGASSNKCCSNPSSALSSASSETHPLQQLKTSFPFASRYRNAPCMSAQSLKTAVCNLQTENGFTVHNSLHLDDSISFLVSVSRLLTDSNASRVNEDSLSCRQTVDGSPLLTFSDFQERNLKNKHCTVGAVWKRQLCHLRGVSSFKSEMVSNKLVTPFKVFDLIQQELITGERSRCSSSRLSLIESLNKKKETGKEKKREKAKKVDKSVGSDVAETIKAFFKRDDNCCKEM